MRGLYSNADIFLGSMSFIAVCELPDDTKLNFLATLKKKYVYGDIAANLGCDWMHG